jgi:hypothetical protein
MYIHMLLQLQTLRFRCSRMWHYVNEFAFPTYWRIVVASYSRLEKSRRHYVCMKCLLVNTNQCYAITTWQSCIIIIIIIISTFIATTISPILTQRTSNKNMSNCKLNLWILEELQSREVLIMLSFGYAGYKQFSSISIFRCIHSNSLPLPNIISVFLCRLMHKVSNLF